MKKVSSLLIFVFLLAACGKEQSFEPVSINPEVDVCEICNMSIAEENYATELFSKEGDVYKFDDIGCMYEFIYKEKKIAEKEIEKQYVRDMENGKWIEAKNAFYAYDKEFWTPMTYGVVAFESESAAKDYVQKQAKGELLSYDQLSEHKWGWKQ